MCESAHNSKSIFNRCDNELIQMQEFAKRALSKHIDHTLKLLNGTFLMRFAPFTSRQCSINSTILPQMLCVLLLLFNDNCHCLKASISSCAAPIPLMKTSNSSIELCLICVFNAMFVSFSFSIYAIMNNPREIETLALVFGRLQIQLKLTLYGGEKDGQGKLDDFSYLWKV